MKRKFDGNSFADGNKAIKLDPILPGILCEAAAKGNVRIVKNLIAAGANINERTNQETPLISACKNNHPEIVYALIEAGVDVNGPVHANDVPLMFACDNGNKTIVEMLIHARANVNASTNDGYNSLMFALFKGRISIANILIKAGANPYCLNNTGENMIFYAIKAQKNKMVKHLLDYGLSVNHEDTQGATALEISIINGTPKILRTILAAGINVNRKWKKNYTPLMLAAKRGKTKMVEILLAAGASIDDVCSKGRNALMIASRFSPVSATVDILIRAKASHKIRDNEGNTALHLACENNNDANVEIVRLLAAAGADAFVLNNNLDTPFDLSMEDNDLSDAIYWHLFGEEIPESP